MSQHHRPIQNNRARWEAVRLACFERDGYACLECGTDEDLQADHVLELEEHPELAFELENLQTLCGPCNRAKHHRQAKAATVRAEYVSPRYLEVLAALAPATAGPVL